MKDNLIVRLSIVCTFGGTIWLTFTKSYVFGEEAVLKVNESRICYNRVNQSPRQHPQIREQMSVPRFHNMKNQFWAVGCGLGWTVK